MDQSFAKGFITLALFPSISGFPSESEALRKDPLQTERLPDQDGYDRFRLTNFRVDLMLLIN